MAKRRGPTDTGGARDHRAEPVGPDDDAGDDGLGGSREDQLLERGRIALDRAKIDTFHVCAEPDVDARLAGSPQEELV